MKQEPALCIRCWAKADSALPLDAVLSATLLGLAMNVHGNQNMREGFSFGPVLLNCRM